MGIALVVPLAAHMLFVRGRALWAHKLSLGAIAAAALVLARPYWIYLATPHPPSPGAGSVVDGWLFPLSGGRLLSARGLEYFYGPGPVDGAVFSTAAVVSSLAYVLVWGGIAVALFYVAQALAVARVDGRGRTSPASSSARIACQAVIDGISAKFEHPHYQNATWISFVLLAWLAVDVAERRRVTRWAAITGTGLLAASLLAAVGALLLGLHRSGGTREIYGPTLANQQQVARALARYAPASDVQMSREHVRAVSAHARDPASAERRPSGRPAPAQSGIALRRLTTRRLERSRWSNADVGPGCRTLSVRSAHVARRCACH